MEPASSFSSEDAESPKSLTKSSRSGYSKLKEEYAKLKEKEEKKKREKEHLHLSNSSSSTAAKGFTARTKHSSPLSSADLADVENISSSSTPDSQSVAPGTAGSAAPPPQSSLAPWIQEVKESLGLWLSDAAPPVCITKRDGSTVIFVNKAFQTRNTIQEVDAIGRKVAVLQSRLAMISARRRHPNMDMGTIFHMNSEFRKAIHRYLDLCDSVEPSDLHDIEPFFGAVYNARIITKDQKVDITDFELQTNHLCIVPLVLEKELFYFSLQQDEMLDDSIEANAVDSLADALVMVDSTASSQPKQHHRDEFHALVDRLRAFSKARPSSPPKEEVKQASKQQLDGASKSPPGRRPPRLAVRDPGKLPKLSLAASMLAAQNERRHSFQMALKLSPLEAALPTISALELSDLAAKALAAEDVSMNFTEKLGRSTSKRARHHVYSGALSKSGETVPLAVKTFSPSGNVEEDTSAQQRLRLEYQLLMRAHASDSGPCDNIVKPVKYIVTECARCPAVLCLEFLEGTPLHGICHTASKVAALGIDLISAVKVLHSQGIIHRDVTVYNVMETSRGLVLYDLELGRQLEDLDGSFLSEAGHQEARRPYSGGAPRFVDYWGVHAVLYHLFKGKMIPKGKQIFEPIQDDSIPPLLRDAMNLLRAAEPQADCLDEARKLLQALIEA